MRVALDARSLQDRPRGGIGRVIANVVEGLGAGVDLTLLQDPRRGPATAGAVALRSSLPTGTAWLQDVTPRWLRSFDGIFHCPFYQLPFRQPVPMVVSLWDLTFEARPEWLPPHKRVAFRTQARHAARTARRIIVSSQVVLEDVCERYAVDPGRVTLAPLAADPVFHPRSHGASPLGDREPYVVAFGGARRRRLDLAVAAWEHAGGPTLCGLVTIGGGGHRPGVTRAGSLEDSELAALVAGARALIYPTEYEGFGLPAVEAQASGTPVICARVGALPEVLGPHAAWTDDHSVKAFSAALRTVVTDDARRLALADAGLAWQAGRPGWDATAAAFARAYREAAT